MAFKPQARIRLIYILLCLGAGLLLARLFFIQIVQGAYYSQKAERQYQRPTANLPDRGTIFFKRENGELVSAAAMEEGFVLAVNPEQITAPETVYRKLNAVVPLERESFLLKAAKPGDSYEEIIPRLETSLGEAVAALNLPGVNVYPTRWRVYPADRLASHVIGFLGYEGDELSGRYGLERQYDGFLSRPAEPSFVNFLGALLAELGGAASVSSAFQSESDVVLTIEPAVQSLLEEKLAALKESQEAEASGGVILDPRTGAIVALAALPDFLPGGKQTDLSLLPNPLVESVFEMGSIVKPLTVAAGLDAGVVTASTVYEDAGTVSLNNRLIANYDGRARGPVPVQEILNQSLNTGAVFVMQKLGRERFRQYFTDFGLADRTGVDLPNETLGLTDHLFSKQEIDYATASFGQGIALSPINMARALSVLANGGMLVTPYVVERLESRFSTLSFPPPSPKAKPRRVLKPASANEISRMLVTVVDYALAGGRVKQEHYSIAAKTGTAQIANLEAGGYHSDRFLHAFFGYFPAYEARFLILLYAVNPRHARYASETLTDPFIDLTKFLLNYYHIPPDR